MFQITINLNNKEQNILLESFLKKHNNHLRMQRRQQKGLPIQMQKNSILQI